MRTQGDSKARKDNLLEESSNHSGVIGGASKGFHPFRHIIHRNQDIYIPPRRMKMAYEVHILNIKDFDLKNIVEGHFVPP